jgi:hypothetical protein
MADFMVELASSQLDRVHSAFNRIDAKASVVLGVNLGMLALLAFNYPFIQPFACENLCGLVPTILIGISMIYLYRSQYPDFKGANPPGSHPARSSTSKILRRHRNNPLLQIFLN